MPEQARTNHGLSGLRELDLNVFQVLEDGFIVFLAADKQFHV